jgi:hypothetical protein
MATEAEIRARAMQEFQMVVEICQIRRAGILQARTEALSGVPAGQAALEVFREAERAADAALATEQVDIQHASDTATIAAHTKHGDANVAAMETLQAENAQAQDDHRAAVEECEAVFTDAFNAAQQMVGPAADQARKAARAARQKALTAADRARTRAEAAADTKSTKALFKNNERMIAETAAAQQEGVDAQQAAVAKRDKAVRTASAGLTKALNADAASRVIEADFQARLLKDFQDAEIEKAAVFEKMRRDLAALGSGSAGGVA